MAGKGLLGLARGGACRASTVTGRAVGSYPTISPLPVPVSSAGHRRCDFCGAVPDDAVTSVAGGRYPPPCPAVLGLSSNRDEPDPRPPPHAIAIVRPPVAWRYPLALTDAPHNTAIWCDPGFAALAGDAVELLGQGVTPVAIGGPASQEIDALARRFDLEANDDPRQLLLHAAADSVFLLTREPPLDRELLASVCEHKTMLTLEPLAADVREAAAIGLGGENADRRTVSADRVLSVPLFAEAPGFRRATDAGEALGEVRGLAIESIGRDGYGSLFARLYDAWVTLLGLVDVPETIDAAIAGQIDPRDDLRKVAGTLSAHARTFGGATLTLMASDRAGRDGRRLVAVGQAAQLTVNDAGYDLVTLGGSPIDGHADTTRPTTVADLVADQWRRAIERGPSTPTAVPPPRRVAALACCEACLLSSRTGQAESPRKVMEMQR